MNRPWSSPRLCVKIDKTNTLYRFTGLVGLRCREEKSPGTEVIIAIWWWQTLIRSSGCLSSIISGEQKEHLTPAEQVIQVNNLITRDQQTKWPEIQEASWFVLTEEYLLRPRIIRSLSRGCSSEVLPNKCYYTIVFLIFGNLYICIYIFGPRCDKIVMMWLCWVRIPRRGVGGEKISKSNYWWRGMSSLNSEYPSKAMKKL